MTLLSEDEAHHATRVLRLRDGDTIEALDGHGHAAPAILRNRGGAIHLEYVQPTLDKSSQLKKEIDPLPITLEMSVLKGDAMEWVIEKSVELGVKQLIPVLTAHTVVQMSTKGPDVFRERWQKIADQALKQCGRLDRMAVHLPITLENLMMTTNREPNHIRLWCDESRLEDTPYMMNWLQSHPISPQNHIHLLIGPEGGWSLNEKTLLRQESIQRIDLGPSILRAETAAIFSISLVVGTLRASKSLNAQMGKNFAAI